MWRGLGSALFMMSANIESRLLELHFTALESIMDILVLDVDVLGSTMVDGFHRRLDTRLIVFGNDKFWSRLVGCP